MEATMRITKAEVLKLARAEWPGAAIRENRNAPTREQREAARALAQAARAKRDEVTVALAAMGKMGDPRHQLAALLEAVVFVCDVDAQEPSLSKLREARRVAEDFIALRDSLPTHDDLNPPNRHGERWQVVTTSSDGPLPFNHIHIRAWADTLEELAEKIKSR